MKCPGRQSLKRAGFTLMEMLIAMAILGFVMALVWQSFAMILRAQRSGEKMLDNLHHGEFVMDNLVEAIRSAAFYRAVGHRFGFILEPREGVKYPRDSISWVKTGPNFVDPGGVLMHGMHRIEFTVDEDGQGSEGAVVRVYPHMADEDDPVHMLDPRLISTAVLGFRCRVYDPELEWWVEEWEQNMMIPGLLELTLYLSPIDDGDEPVIMTRVVEIPVSPQLRKAARFVEPERVVTGPPEDRQEPRRRTRRPSGRDGGDAREPTRRRR